MPNVFLSHAASDSNLAFQVHNELAKAGIKTWLDKVEIKAGESWEDKINEGLKNASLGILLLSPAALNSPTVAHQYRYLLAQNKPLYMAAIEPVAPGALPYYLRPIQAVDLTQDFAAGIATLRQAIQNNLHSPAATRSANHARSRLHVTVEVDLDTDDVSEVVSKINDVLGSEVQGIRVISGGEEKSGSNVLDSTRGPATAH